MDLRRFLGLLLAGVLGTAAFLFTLFGVGMVGMAVWELVTNGKWELASMVGVSGLLCGLCAWGLSRFIRRILRESLPGSPRTAASPPDGGSSPSPAYDWAWYYLMIFLLPSIHGAIIGEWVSAQGGIQNLRLARPSLGSILGGSAGLLLSLSVFLDNRRIQRRLAEEPHLEAESGQQPPTFDRPVRWAEMASLGMLIIPAVTGLIICNREALELGTAAVGGLRASATLATAILGYLDLRWLISAWPGRRRLVQARWSPAMNTFLGLLFLWVLAFPYHFLTRIPLGGASRVRPALAVTLLFFVPGVWVWWAGPILPSVHDPAVFALVQQAFEASPEYQARRPDGGVTSIREPREIAYDRAKPRRTAQATARTEEGDQTIYFTLEWLDRKQETVAVRVFDHPPGE